MDGMYNEPEQLRDRIGGYRSAPGATGITLEILPIPIWFPVPDVSVNGRTVLNVARGAHHIPLPPGDHRLRVTNRQFGGPDFGSAHTVVPVTEGRATHVYYRPPVVNLMSGVIGPEPRGLSGTVFAYVLMAVLIAVMVVCFVIAYR